MASSSKKITYTNDFKLKVLDYYFKHGGDNSFGLKTKTAHHFNIDKKTINRMLNNPDIVKKARKLGAKKTVLTSAKSGGKNIGRNVKTIHKSSLTSKSSSGTGVSSSTTASKTSSHGSSSSVSGSTKHGSSTASSSTTSSGAKGGGGQGNKAALSSGKSGPSGPGRPSKTTNDDDIEVQVFELPEDPDYSVLKRSINTSTNGVAGISKLLVTGTPEVQNMLLNECDIIMECKVCRNLFRSVANFLAHKRIYCRETYSDVRSLFHKGETEGVTNQSGTVIVVPEPPSEEAEIAASTSSQHLSSSVQSTKPSGINNITASLVSSQKPQELSSSTGKGTSKYYEKILEVNKKRNLISQDCSVVLEDIAGVTNARFQSYNSKDPSSKSIKCIVDQIQQKSLGLTVVLNEHGQITKTAPGNAEIDDIRDELEEEEPQPPSLVCSICNTSFATRKTLSHHQRSLHGLDRAIFSCPLCKNNFLSMWATVKHLQRFHRKSTTYIQRVRNTIKERSRVKPIPKKLEKMKDQTDDSDEEEDEDEEEAIGKEKSEGLEQEVNVEKENQAMDQEKVEEKIYKVDTPKKDKEEMVKQSTPQSASSCAVSSDITGMSTAKDSPVVQWQCKQCGQVVQSQQEGTDHMGSVHLHCQATKLKSVHINSSRVVPVAGDVSAEGIPFRNRSQANHNENEVKLVSPIDISEAGHDVPTTVDEDFISMSGFDDIGDPSTYFIPSTGKKDRQWEPHSEDEIRQEASKLHLFEDSVSSKSGSGSPKSQNEVDENNSEISESVDVENLDTECGRHTSNDEFSVEFSRDLCSKDVNPVICERPKRQIKVKRCEDFDYDIHYIPKGRSDSRVSQTVVTKTYVGKGKLVESVITAPSFPETDSVCSTPRATDDEEYEIVFFKNKNLERSPVCDGIRQESKSFQNSVKKGSSSKTVLLEKMTPEPFFSVSGAFLGSQQNDDCFVKDKVSMQTQCFEVQEVEGKEEWSGRSKFQDHKRKGPYKDISNEDTFFMPSCSSRTSYTGLNYIDKKEECSTGNEISVKGIETQIKEEEEPDPVSSCIPKITDDHTQKSSGQAHTNESSMDLEAVATIKLETDDTSAGSGEVHRERDTEPDLINTQVKEEIKEVEVHEEVSDFDLDTNPSDITGTYVGNKGRMRREYREIPEAMSSGLNYEIEIKNESEEEMEILKEEAFSPDVHSDETLGSKTCEGMSRNKDSYQKIDLLSKENIIRKASQAQKETDGSDKIGSPTSFSVETLSCDVKTEDEIIECGVPKEGLSKEMFRKDGRGKDKSLEKLCKEASEKQISKESRGKEVILKTKEDIARERIDRKQSMIVDRRPKESTNKDKSDLHLVSKKVSSDCNRKETFAENVSQKGTTALEVAPKTSASDNHFQENTEDSISKESQISKDSLKKDVQYRQHEESCSKTEAFIKLSLQDQHFHKACQKKTEECKTSVEKSVKGLGITEERKKKHIPKDQMLRKDNMPKDVIQRSATLQGKNFKRDRLQSMYVKNRINETSAIDKAFKKSLEKCRAHQKCLVQVKTKMKCASSRKAIKRTLVDLMKEDNPSKDKKEKDVKVNSMQEGTSSQFRDNRKPDEVHLQHKSSKELKCSTGHMKLDRQSCVAESYRDCTKRVSQEHSFDISDSCDKVLHKDPPRKKLRIGLINKTFEFSHMNQDVKRISDEVSEVNDNVKDAVPVVMYEECRPANKTVSTGEESTVTPTGSVSSLVSDEDGDTIDISVMPAKNNEWDIDPVELPINRTDEKGKFDTCGKSETLENFYDCQSYSYEELSKSSPTSIHSPDPLVAIASCSASSGGISGLSEIESKDVETIPSKVSVPCVTVIKARKEYHVNKEKALNTGPSHLMTTFTSHISKGGQNENVTKENLDTKNENAKQIQETKGHLDCGTSKVTKICGSESPAVGSSNISPMRNEFIRFTGGITSLKFDDHSVKVTEPSLGPAKECSSSLGSVTSADNQKNSEGHMQYTDTSELRKSRGSTKFVEVLVSKGAELGLPRVKAALQSSLKDASPSVSNVEIDTAQVKTSIQDSRSMVTVLKKVVRHPVSIANLPGTSESKTDMFFPQSVSDKEELKAEGVGISPEQGIDDIQERQAQKKSKDDNEALEADRISGKSQTLRHCIDLERNVPAKELSCSTKASTVVTYKPVLPVSAVVLDMSTASVETQTTSAFSTVSKSKAICSLTTSTSNHHLEKSVPVSTETEHLESDCHPVPEFKRNSSVKHEYSPSKELDLPVVLKVQTKSDDVPVSEKFKVRLGNESQVLVKSGQSSFQTIAEDAADSSALGEHTSGKTKLALVPHKSLNTKSLARRDSGVKSKTQISLESDCISTGEATASVLGKGLDNETQLSEVPHETVSTRQTVCNKLLHESESFSIKDFQKSSEGKPNKHAGPSDSSQKEDSWNESEGSCSDESSETGEVKFGLFAQAKTLNLDVGMLKKTREKMLKMKDERTGKVKTKKLWAFIKTMKSESPVSSQSVKDTRTGSCISLGEVPLKDKESDENELVLHRTITFRVSGKHDYTRNPSRTPSPDTFSKESSSKKVKRDTFQSRAVGNCGDTWDMSSTDADSMAFQNAGNVSRFRNVSDTPEDPILKVSPTIDTLYDLEGEAVHHQDATFGDLSYSHDLL